MKQIPIGTIVTIEAPGGRGDNGNTRTITAIVLSQWPEGSLELFAFHFEGSFLVRAVPLSAVKLAGQADVI